MFSNENKKNHKFDTKSICSQMMNELLYYVLMSFIKKKSKKYFDQSNVQLHMFCYYFDFIRNDYRQNVKIRCIYYVVNL